MFSLVALIAFLATVGGFFSFGWGIQLACSTWETSSWGGTAHQIAVWSNLAITLVLTILAALLADAVGIAYTSRTVAMFLSLLGVPLGYLVRKHIKNRRGV